MKKESNYKTIKVKDDSFIENLNKVNDYMNLNLNDEVEHVKVKTLKRR